MKIKRYLHLPNVNFHIVIKHNSNCLFFLLTVKAPFEQFTPPNTNYIWS